MKARILLADDSPTILMVVGSTLEQAGYEVVTAADGVEAAEKAFTCSPDLILLDVMMPRLNGYQVCRLLKHEPGMSHVPIVIQTSRDQPRDRFWGYQTGADEYVTKGLDQQQRLLEVVAELLADRRAQPNLNESSKANGEVDVLQLSNDLLDEKLFQATVVNEIGKLTASLQNYEQTVDSVLSLVHRLMDYTVAGIAVIHGDEGEMTLKIWSPVTREYLEEFKQRTTLEINKYVHANTNYHGFRTELLYAEGLGNTMETENCPGAIGSFLLVPIIAKGRVVGGLAISSPSGIQLSKDDESTLNLIATHAYVVIDNAWLYDEVKRLSITDALTKVYNRRYLEERLDQEFRRSERHKSNLSCLMLDVDHFKHVNDEFGHQAGDMVLRMLMVLTKQVTRATDIIGRYGGEEFVLLLPETDLYGGKCVGERLRKLVESQVLQASGRELRVTISLGLCTVPAGSIETPADLIKAADTALYKAKESGRNRMCISEVNEQEEGLSCDA